MVRVTWVISTLRNYKMSPQQVIGVLLWSTKLVDGQCERLFMTDTHTRLTALCPGLPRWGATRKVNQSGFYWSKRQWVAVASAGLYASLHLASDKQPHQHPTTLMFFTGRMPFLPPNQQHQSTEGTLCLFMTDLSNKYFTGQIFYEIFLSG